MQKKKSYLYGTFFLIVSVVFSVLTKTVDVGPQLSGPPAEIGFSTINNRFHAFTKVHMSFYDITDVMGIIAIGFGLIFGAVGLFQLIKRKNIFKLDRYIYCLGGTYALLGIIYAVFEKISINYRPIYMNGINIAEPSFPSSHTLLICTILTTAIIQVNRIFEGYKGIKTGLTVFGCLYIAVAVVLRLFSGVHWLTDIVASLLMTTSITFFYYGLSKEEKPVKVGKHSA
ncbi:MAG: phosphatase PAP2 family protein [Clostridia bacterium]|nr:phosphatase PAP2 family protein [Clostridia bacterium]